MAEPITEATLVGWVTIKEALELWPDAPGEPEDDYAPLPILLGTAHAQLLRYARKAVFTDPAAIPPEVKMAQVLMVQHVAARKRSGDGEGYGTDTFQASTYPLVLEAKANLKPWRTVLGGLR